LNVSTVQQVKKVNKT